MDFELSEEHQQLRDAVRRLAHDHLADRALERAHSVDYPWDAAELLAQHQLLGLTLDEADGGQGGTLLDAVLVLQEVARACPKSADVVQAGNFGAIRTFAAYASAELKARFLPQLLAGRALVSVAMSEPDAGSAVTDLRTTFTPDGDEIVVDGTKVFGTNSTDATLFLVYGRFGPGVDGIGSVVVEQGTPGMERGKPSLFMSGEAWSPVYFDGCRIPRENLVLGPGGFKKQMSGFNVERLGNATRALALGQLAFETARRHALEREQFGRPLCEFQGLQWKFADAAVKLDAAELLVYRAASGADRSMPDPQQTAMAKLAANTAGFEAANEALQVLGASGYSQDGLVEYCVRRTRGWQIAGGSLEMMRNRIAEGIFERRFGQRR